MAKTSLTLALFLPIEFLRSLGVAGVAYPIWPVYSPRRESRQERLLIVGDGALQYLPFGAMAETRSESGAATKKEAQPNEKMPDLREFRFECSLDSFATNLRSA